MKRLFVPDAEGYSIEPVHILNKLVKLIKTLDFISLNCKSSKLSFKLRQTSISNVC